MRSARRALAWGALLLALLALRAAPLAALRTTPEERAAGTGALLLDHPGTLVTLRRAALALASGRVPASDRWLAWPDEVELPSPPLLAALVAACVELSPAREDDRPEAALGGASEAQLERVSLVLGPALGLCAAAAAGGCVLFLGARASRAVAAWLAAALLGAAPEVLRVTQSARLDERALVLALAALACLGLARSLVGRDALARSGGALLAGVASGLAVAAAPAGLLVLAAGLALVVRVVWGRDELAAESARREGLLFAFAAAVLAAVPGLEGPWELAPSGRLPLAARSAAELALGGGLLLLVASVIPRRVGPLARGLLVLGAAGALAWLAREGLAAQLALAREARALADPSLEGGAAPSLAERVRAAADALGPLLVLTPWAAWRVLRRAPGATRAASDARERPSTAGEALEAPARPRALPARPWLAALALLGWLACFASRSLAPLVALPCALVSAIALAELAPRPRAALALASLALGALAAGGVSAEASRERPERLAEQLALRGLRARSPSPGPWNAAAARASWAVLAAPALGPAIAWHARRAALLSGPYPAGPERERRLEAWRADDGSGERLSELGVAYVLRPRAEGVPTFMRLLRLLPPR